MVTAIDSLERWTVRKLLELIPGTSRAFWRHTALPSLVANGVLVKIGRGWVGRRVAIEAALLNRGGTAQS